MATDNPYPAPAPLVLADMCATQAWKDDIDDESRKIHEWTAEVIRQLVRENHRLTHKAEQLDGTGAGLILGHAQVNLEWLGQLHADGKHRV